MTRVAKIGLISVCVLFLGVKQVNADVVGFWKFESGEGTLAADYSGNGFDGMILGDAQWDVGPARGALNCNAGGYVLAMDPCDHLSITDAISVGAWTYMDVNSAGEMSVVSKGNWSGGGLPYELTIDASNGGGWWQAINDTGYHEMSYTGLTLGEWHHVVGTFDGLTYKVYVDGNQVNEMEGAGALAVNELPLTIGKRSGVEENFVDGMLDEVFVCNHAMSAEEVVASMTGLRVKLPGVVGYWNFEEGDGTIAADTSGNELDGMIIGGAQWDVGPIGGALDCNGVGYVVAIDPCDFLSLTDAISVGAWTYMDVNSNGEMSIIGKGNWSGGGLPYELTVVAPEGSGWWQAINDSGYHELNYDGLTLGEWHHVAGTYDGVIYKVYVDGKLANEHEGAGLLAVNELPLTIGKRSGVEENYMNGKLDEVFVCNRALSASEVVATMAGLDFDVVDPNGSTDAKDAPDQP